MNISNTPPTFDRLTVVQSDSPAPAQRANGQTVQPPNVLTVRTSAAAPEDVEAARIPDAALSRDDALGALVASAFNLPPPPMPAFDR